MVNGVLYWLTEYAKVLFGYGFDNIPPISEKQERYF